MNKKLEILTIGIVFIFMTCSQARGEVTISDIMHNLFGTSVNNYQAMYNNNDNTKVFLYSEWAYGTARYQIARCTKKGDCVANNGWPSLNITINGEFSFGGSDTNSKYRQTCDFDENGRIQALYNDVAYHSGNLVESYKYAEDGQVLVYNPSGELIGAYNNWYDRKIAQSGYYDKATELNHLENGNYTAKDENDNISEVYYQNGDYTKNTYDRNGNLIFSGKYNKDDEIIQSSSNKYDAGGNLIAAYENGVVTYRRRIYTPAEATAAVQKGAKNTFSIIYR